MSLEYILEMRNIRKEFPGVVALDEVTFTLEKGKIYAICGENGAGKSTLMKVLSGFYPHNSFAGEIFVGGRPVSFQSIADSEKEGIAIIYQELALVKQMSICENIFLGNERKKNGKISWDETVQQAKHYMNEVGLALDPHTKVNDIGIGQQQLVEIAKAMTKNAKILILDEPTAALNEAESASLLALMKKFKAQGVTCVYISHKLGEVMEVSDKIIVLRDGKSICTLDTADTNEDEIIRHMVGRDMTQRYPSETHTPGETVLKVSDWSVTDDAGRMVLNNICFEAKKGEILGIAGLMGAGRTELATSLIGAFGHRVSGTIEIEQKAVKNASPAEAIQNGLSYVSEDRKRYGLVLGMDIKDNICLPNLYKILKGFSIDENKKISTSEQYRRDLKIKTPSLEQKVKNLSGGNQQKVVLSKWMMSDPKILILDEPTRGIDVGAKYEIYTIMNQLVEKGLSIIMISSELPEVLGMSDRILIMSEGKITGEFSREQANANAIMKAATATKETSCIAGKE